MKNIFITGMLRSGTTLLEKLLHNHPNLTVGSQPYFPMYLYYKRKYYQEKGVTKEFPLGNYFLEGDCELQDFYNFLKQYELGEADLNEMVKSIIENNANDNNFKRHLTLLQLKSGYFIDVYKKLNDLMPSIFPKQNLIYQGIKEVICEEYLPFLLNETETKGIIIIRDPRNIIASLNYGNFSKHVGEIRPLLFNLRNWRKSIAFAIYLENNTNFKLIRYEDLVSDYINQLNTICGFIGVSTFKQGFFDKGIRDQYGKTWTGNSSFKKINKVKGSTEHYKKVLPSAVLRYIETCCMAEMKYFGYELSSITEFKEENISLFIEPYQINRPEFPQDYSSDIKRVSEEVIRYYKLKENLNSNEAKKWFLFEEVYKQLKTINV